LTRICPKKNGIQTLQVLKNDPRYSEINVVIYSTYADQQLVNEALKNGASKVVSKPISMEGYCQMMDDLLQLVLLKATISK
jgi:CheY-like chemotaxis protein